MRGTPPVFQIVAEKFPPGVKLVHRSESGELSKDGHRPSTVRVILHASTTCSTSFFLYTRK